MTIDASIPLKAQVPNFFGTIVGADQAAAQQNEALHQKGLRNFLRDNGAAVYAGDDAALGQLAQYDPQQALGIRSTRDEMAARQERLRLARAAGARAAANARLSREEKAQAKAEYNQLQSLWLTGKDNPEILAQGINTLGLHQIGVTPENFIDYLGTAEGAASELFGKIQEATPEPASPQSGLGKIQADINLGFLPEGTPLRSNQSETVYDPATGNPIFSRGREVPKLNVEEGKNTGFYLRTLQANEILDKFDTEGTSIAGRALEGAPLGLGNFAQGENYQLFEQAARDFTNAVLRRESGAAIHKDEFANATRQYFPVPGDGPAVIEQKRANRKATIEGLRISAAAGGAFVDQQANPAVNSGSQGDLGGTPPVGNVPAALDKIESDLREKYPELFEN